MTMRAPTDWDRASGVGWAAGRMKRRLGCARLAAPPGSPRNPGATHETNQIAAALRAQVKAPANAGLSSQDGAFDSLPSCLIRYAHSKAIADYFKLRPADQQLVDSQRNVAVMVAGSFDDRTFGKQEKVANRKSHDGYIEAESARQPWHAIERIFSTRRRRRVDRLGKHRFRVLDCRTHGTLTGCSLLFNRR